MNNRDNRTTKNMGLSRAKLRLRPIPLKGIPNLDIRDALKTKWDIVPFSADTQALNWWGVVYGLGDFSLKECKSY